jgi:hypothetical protein
VLSENGQAGMRRVATRRRNREGGFGSGHARFPFPVAGAVLRRRPDGKPEQRQSMFLTAPAYDLTALW